MLKNVDNVDKYKKRNKCVLAEFPLQSTSVDAMVNQKISPDMKQQALQLIEEGWELVVEVADVLGVSSKSIECWDHNLDCPRSGPGQVRDFFSGPGPGPPGPVQPLAGPGPGPHWTGSTRAGPGSGQVQTRT